MRPISSRLRNALIVVSILTLMAAAYWAGYKMGYPDGLRDKGPQHRFLVVVRRTPGNPNSSGSSATLFDIRDPRDAARLAKEEQRLKAIGAEYYIAKGLTETTIRPEPDPRRVNSHR
jgi:hypothetical protein